MTVFGLLNLWELPSAPEERALKLPVSLPLAARSSYMAERIIIPPIAMQLSSPAQAVAAACIITVYVSAELKSVSG